MRRIDQGEAVDRDEFLAQFPDVAAALRSHFATCDFVEEMAGPPLSVAGKQPLAPTSDTASVSLADDETLPPSADSASDGKPRDTGREIKGSLGRYRIVKTLGKGGMGAVYLAEDPNLDRLVAIKVPFFDKSDEKPVLDRFQREAKSAAAIQHPNICPIHDVGVIDGVPFIAMAYIEGKPLSELIQPDKPLPIRPVLLLVRRLALALEEAHRRGVIHRDLKPANVMVNKRREPIIMDFGLARREGRGDVQLTKSGQMMGTPSYMPPEQLSGKLEDMGPGCDIYSLGVMLYQLLTGRAPFTGDLLAIISQIALDEPEPPSTHRSEIDGRLDRICLKAMAKEVNDRFRSMGEFAKVLTSYIKSQGSQAPATTPAAPSKDVAGELFDKLLATELSAPAQKEPQQPPPREPQRPSPPPSFPTIQTAPRRQPSARSRRRRPMSPRSWTTVGASLVGLLLLMGAAIVLLREPTGTIKIEADEPNATVVDNGVATNTGAGETVGRDAVVDDDDSQDDPRTIAAIGPPPVVASGDDGNAATTDPDSPDRDVASQGKGGGGTGKGGGEGSKRTNNPSSQIEKLKELLATERDKDAFGNPPDVKKIEQFLQQQIALRKKDGRFPRFINVRFGIGPDGKIKGITFGAGGAGGGGSGGGKN